MVVLDSPFLIDLQQAMPAALRRLEALERAAAPIRVPAAAWIEYLSGLMPDVRVEAIRRLEAAASFEPFTREFADEAVRIQAELAAQGGVMGWHDLQIAATASYLREPLVSNDRSFRKVAGLALLNH